MHRSPPIVRGFSLVEVIIAIGVFSVAVVGVISLLSPITSQVRQLKDSKIANNLRAPIREELNSMKFTSFVNEDFTAIASDWLDNVVNPTIDRPAQYPTVLASLVALQDGSRVNEIGWAETNALIPRDDQYFLIQVLEPQPPANTDVADLRYAANDAHVAFNVEISWPFRLSGGAEVPYANRKKFSFFTVVAAGEPL